MLPQRDILAPSSKRIKRFSLDSHPTPYVDLEIGSRLYNILESASVNLESINKSLISTTEGLSCYGSTL